MIPQIEMHRDAIAALCRKYGLKRLEVFGSAARGDFDPDASDCDFFYEFVSNDPAGLADRFFGFQEELERLLGRRADLVSARDARNPYFLEVANRDRVTLYAA
jgi:uncharacterized protein